MYNKNVLQPISHMREVPIKPEYKESVKSDLQKVDPNEVFIIKSDVFELFKFAKEIVSVVRNSDQKKTIEALKHSKKLWKVSLKKSNGDYEKAVHLYEKG